MNEMKKNFFRKMAVGICTIFVAGLLGGCVGNPNQASGTAAQGDSMRIGALKGPTSMGLLFLQEKAAQGETALDYEFTMETAADELLVKIVKDELDVALVPANVAALLYQKTQGAVEVIDINTQGVLYLVSGDQSITDVSSLKGKTILLTGKGTTPDYVLRYLLAQNGIGESDVTMEYKSEATEVAALLAENPDQIGLLPQPFATAACMQNDKLTALVDLNQEWDRVQGNEKSSLVTGVTVVRKAYLEEHEQAVQSFMKEHKDSAEAIGNDIEKGALLVVNAGIVAKEAIALKAIPLCNITYIDGEEMQSALGGYLKVLFEQNPESVGGSLPGEDFYYLAE